MCLRIERNKQIDIQTANENIQCYKVLQFYPKNSRYYTPFQHFNISFNEDGFVIMKSMEENMSDETYHNFLHRHLKEDDYSYYLEEGVIHSYVNYKDAIASAAHLEGRMIESEVHKAIIPKGTNYVVSFDGKQIGSRVLKVFKKKEKK